MNAALKPPIEDALPIFKGAMRQTAGGISVITAGLGEERTGLTVTSAVSLSMAPPTMIVCVNRAASAWPIIHQRRHFCVNALASHHQAIADRFAGLGGVKGVARYAGASWSVLSTGALALDDCIASIDCEVEEFVERHSHTIVIGAVRAVRAIGGKPLLYSQGQYGEFAPH
jgi:3-hydroxy-9,10-secoandrosta-1,3,5(10)-triene-9,17-dione monooxygenase reductase component